MKSKFGLKNDYYQGAFKFWYPNKNLGVTGQTKNGEVDGKWKQFYLNGNRHYHSISRVGEIVSQKVWKVDGQLCPESNVENANGSFIEYDKNRNRIDKHVYQNGVRVKESVSE